MSCEHDTAARIASKGLRIIDKILDELEATPREDWGKTHVRDVTDCVLAAVKVQAEEREQLEFDKEHSLGDLRRLLVEYLASLKPHELTQLVAEAQAGTQDARQGGGEA